MRTARFCVNLQILNEFEQHSNDSVVGSLSLSCRLHVKVINNCVFGNQKINESLGVNLIWNSFKQCLYPFD